MEILAQVWGNTRMFSAALSKEGKYIKLHYIHVMKYYVAVKKYSKSLCVDVEGHSCSINWGG